MGRNWF